MYVCVHTTPKSLHSGRDQHTRAPTAARTTTGHARRGDGEAAERRAVRVVLADGQGVGHDGGLDGGIEGGHGGAGGPKREGGAGASERGGSQRRARTGGGRAGLLRGEGARRGKERAGARKRATRRARGRVAWRWSSTAGRESRDQLSGTSFSTRLVCSQKRKLFN